MDRHRNGVLLIAALIPSGCGPMGSVGPSRAEAQRSGEQTCRPIIAALANYHSLRGNYPDSLGDLVTSNLIDRVPDTPEIGQSKRGGVLYQVSLPTDVYRLSFSYDIPDELFGAIIRFSYWSDEERWTSRKYTPSFWSETCDRAAMRYREKRDENTLRAFIATVAREPESDSLYESRVKGWLGEGEPNAIPNDVSVEEGRIGYCYGTKDGSSRICFTYKTHFVRSREGESNSPIVDTLYEIESRNGIEKWRVLLKTRSSRTAL